MRIATWNINSVRIRLHLVEELVRAAAPDIVCLQETKAQESDFPEAALCDLGFPYIAYSGMKGYNGVAILSRIPLGEVERRDWCGRSDARHISAALPDGTELHNFYVPAGGDVPDPEANDKFAHKLQFLDEVRDWFPAARDPGRPMLMVGDLNIAPLETDVWSHKQLLKVVSHTPVEVEKLDGMQAAGGWVDAVRHVIPPEEKLYTWWSYRARDWSAADKGRRLDHVWVTPPLTPLIGSAEVLRDARGWARASDHAPVIVDLKD